MPCRFLVFLTTLGVFSLLPWTFPSRLILPVYADETGSSPRVTPPVARETVAAPRSPEVVQVESEAGPGPATTPKSPPAETAADKELQTILGLADSAYQNLNTYQADFDQESETKTVQMQRKSSGKMFFQKPDKMRWSYTEPEAREVFLTGDQIIVYLPARNTVVKQAIGEALPGIAPARLFMGVSELQETFRISLAPAEHQQPGTYCLRLAPRQRAGVSAEEIFLWLSRKDLLPVRSESRDLLGNVTKLTFHDARTNPPLQADLFRFEVPAGAEVIEEND